MNKNYSRDGKEMLPVKYLWQSLRPSLKVKFKSFQQWPGFHLLKMNFPNSGTIWGFFPQKVNSFLLWIYEFQFSPLSSSKVCVRLLTTWGGHLLKKRDSIIVCLTMTRWPVTIILRLIDFFHLFCFTWQGFEGCSWPPLREACQTNRQLLAACCFLGRCKHQLFCYTTNCISQLS